MISNRLKEKYMQIHAQLIKLRAENCTQREIANDLEVSLRKYSDFENKKIIDLEMLFYVAGYFSIELDIIII